MKNVCLVLVFVLLCRNAPAQWVQTNGPYGGSIHCFAVSGTNLFAGTSEGGVFLSTNNGTSWRAANVGSTNTQVEALTISDTYLFAGTSDGVFRSTDNGTSWCAVSSGLRNSIILLLYRGRISLPERGLPQLTAEFFFPTNDGTSWTVASNGLTDNFLQSPCCLRAKSLCGDLLRCWLPFHRQRHKLDRDRYRLGG